MSNRDSDITRVSSLLNNRISSALYPMMRGTLCASPCSIMAIGSSGTTSPSILGPTPSEKADSLVFAVSSRCVADTSARGLALNTASAGLRASAPKYSTSRRALAAASSRVWIIPLAVL
ncbi:Uncharacterised protein [Mycobacteroides abscessus subsp. abscessus]|nr:Uncharacterised protein [Mycobacteroides abscessus subsp. abscessus]SKV05358.1 Uncharacterised protein [Mycobacteroides abscessus subsp. abscessus]